MDFNLLLCIQIIFLNIQGLSGKENLLEAFLNNKTCHYICISEHWLNGDNIKLTSINGYNNISYFTRTSLKRGGVAIYALENIKCEKLDLNPFCCEKNFEVCGIIDDTLKLILINIYRTPDSDVNVFLGKLNDLLIYLLRWSKYRIVIGGDTNSAFDITTKKKEVSLILLIYYYSLDLNVIIIIQRELGPV